MSNLNINSANNSGYGLDRRRKKALGDGNAIK